MYEDDKMRAQNPEAHPIVAVIDDYYDGHISAGVHPMVFVVRRGSSGDLYTLSYRPGRLAAVMDYLKKWNVKYMVQRNLNIHCFPTR